MTGLLAIGPVIVPVLTHGSRHGHGGPPPLWFLMLVWALAVVSVLPVLVGAGRRLIRTGRLSVSDDDIIASLGLAAGSILVGMFIALTIVIVSQL